MEARIRELERAAPCEVIDVDAAAKNTMVVFLAIEELRKDTEEGWKKLAVPLDQVIEANNASNVGLKKRDVQLARREDIMDGRVCANRVKIDELSAKVTRHPASDPSPRCRIARKLPAYRNGTSPVCWTLLGLGGWSARPPGC